MHPRAFRHLPTRIAVFGLTLVFLGAAWLAGCVQGQGARVSGDWQKDAPRSQAFTRVLIVGISPNINRRCMFEQFLASQMASASTTAIQSCDAMKPREPLTVEGVEQAVASQRADAVLATSLVARDWSEQEGGSRDTRGGAYYKATDAGYATGFYGVYGVPVVYGEFQTAPSITTLEGEVHVTSKLYETKGRSLVYTVDTKARDLESTDAGIATITGPIAERLRREGLIR